MRLLDHERLRLLIQCPQAGTDDEEAEGRRRQDTVEVCELVEAFQPEKVTCKSRKADERNDRRATEENSLPNSRQGPPQQPERYAREQEGDGTAEPVGQGVDLGRAASTRAADRLALLPPLPPAPTRRG